MNIMVVDDSIVYRSGICQALEEIPSIKIVKRAGNGKIAIEYLKNHPEVNLITLDLEMPVMNGIETITKIREFNKNVKIILFSSMSVRGAEQTINALSLGADDFVAKVSTQEGSSLDDGIQLIRESLIPKIKVLVPENSQNELLKKKVVLDQKNKESSQADTSLETFSNNDFFDEMPMTPRLIVIGSSTGGPDALRKIFSNLTVRPKVPILIVQHMPPIFTERLAKTLNNESMAEVKEAKNGENMEGGFVYIAPGDYHMYLNDDNKLTMDQSEKECFVRPCVNKLFESVYKNYKRQVLSIVLTGMGEDGARGVELLKTKKAYSYIQDKESCAIWGMPGAVCKKQIGAISIPLENISKLIDSISMRL